MNQLQTVEEQVRAVSDFFQQLAAESARLRYQDPVAEEMAA
jgi:hypothetical protein